MELISDKEVTVRKQRNCFGCLELIKKGESAYIQTNKDDDYIYSITLCMNCRKKISNLHYDDEFREGDLRDS